VDRGLWTVFPIVLVIVLRPSSSNLSDCGPWTVDFPLRRIRISAFGLRNLRGHNFSVHDSRISRPNSHLARHTSRIPYRATRIPHPVSRPIGPSGLSRLWTLDCGLWTTFDRPLRACFSMNSARPLEFKLQLAPRRPGKIAYDGIKPSVNHLRTRSKADVSR